MNYKERKQIEYLNNIKLGELENFIGKCEMINRQIREVRNGMWYERILEEQKNRSE